MTVEHVVCDILVDWAALTVAARYCADESSRNSRIKILGGANR